MVMSVAIPPQSGSSHENISRPQAHALPKKRGEIGYVERDNDKSRSSSPDVMLSPRHPADVEHRLGVNQPTANPQTQPYITTSEAVSTVDAVSKRKRRQLRGLFSCKSIHQEPRKVAGITLPTLTKFSLQALALVGTVIIWVLVARFLMKAEENHNTSVTIFMHATFSIVILGQLLLLERRIFRMRAERYSYVHPGELLARFRNQNTAPDDVIALSPWNRPPIPTYAAVLEQIGSGTGEVEDHAIAQQPPPVYGNTRGSTFLLSGFLSDDQRLQRPPSVHSVISMVGRPKSYASRDDEWEEIQNAERAIALEETLAKLQRTTTHWDDGCGFPHLCRTVVRWSLGRAREECLHYFFITHCFLCFFLVSSWLFEKDVAVSISDW